MLKAGGTIRRRVARYFSEGVGADGGRVPAPPEMFGFWVRLRPILGGCFVLFFLGLSIALSPQLFAEPTRAPELALLVILGAVACTGGVAGALVVVPAIFWPWTRRQFGRSQEAKVREWRRRQFDDAIEEAERAAALPRATQRASRRRYIAWLYKEREQTHGVSIPDPVRDDVLSLSGPETCET